MDTKELLYRYRIGSVEFDEARFELRVGSLVVELERKPLQVFGELLRHANEVVTRRQLIDAVWDGRLTVDQALANAIVKLRKALEDPQGQLIVTVPRHGYKCIGAVERIVVGRRIQSHFTLRAGDNVPSRSDFRLESQLQATSNGEVWLASQLNGQERRVFKFGRDGEQLWALKREVTVFRLLRDTLGERSDFVRILNWNFESPPFYIECECGGTDLAAWAGVDQRLTKLSIAQRLELFLQIAAALQAAHGVGVLHKDLKPANVLIAPAGDDNWQVRVADFGNAMLLDPERLRELGITRFGLTVTGINAASQSSGTPLYMAPEIIDGEPPTIRSDVYSLGLLLYQLVIGNLRRPLAPGWEEDVVDPLLREDIAAATAGDVRRRLASVDELVVRLQSLDVRAANRQRAAEESQRAALAELALQRASARRPWLIAAIASLTLGMAISLWLYASESAAHREAERQSSRFQAANRYLTELLRIADPNISGGAAKLTLEDALALARNRLDGQFDQDPATKGSLYATLGEAYFGWGKYQEALPLQQQAARLLAAALGAADAATLTAQYQLARTLDMLTRHGEARELLAQTDRAAGRRLQQDSSLALLANWAGGGNALMQMNPTLALEKFKKAEAIRARAFPDDDAWLVRVRADLAWCAVRLQRYAEAVQILDELLAAAYTPERIGIGDWTKVHLQYALALMNLGESKRAEQVVRNAIAETQRALDPNHYLVGLGWNHLAAVFESDARWDQASDAARRAYDIFYHAVGEQSRATLGALGDLAVYTYLKGNLRDSLVQLEAAHNELARAVGPTKPLTQHVDFFWANALLDACNAAAASRLLESLDPTALAAVDSGSDWQLRVQGLRGRALLAINNKEGLALLQSAVTLLSENKAKPWVLAPLQRSLQQQSRGAQCNHSSSRHNNRSQEKQDPMVTAVATTK